MHSRSRSDRSFRVLLTIAILLMIALPCLFAFHYHRLAAFQHREIDALNAELGAQVSEAEELRSSVAALQAILDAGPALSADGPSYQELYPDFYAPEPLNATERKSNTVYLTFDDGPSERTDSILKTLSDEGVKATFFVIGRTAEADKERMKKIVADGHTLGMHSYSHNYTKIYASVEDYLADMYQLFTLIRDTTGTTPEVFRFPGGSINSYDHGVYQEIIAEMLRRGFVPYDWNVSSLDATGQSISVSQMVDTVANGVSRHTRSIVLMHDAEPKKTTAEALPSMIQRLKSMGCQFDRLSAHDAPVLFGYPE